MSMVEKSYFVERWKYMARLEKEVKSDELEIESCKWTKVYKLLRSRQGPKGEPAFAVSGWDSSHCGYRKQ